VGFFIEKVQHYNKYMKNDWEVVFFDPLKINTHILSLLLKTL
jgi:hypothetical protein